MKSLRSLLLALFFAAVSGLVFAEPVDVNTADAATLANNLRGVGLKRAEAIVAYRSEHGPFKSVDELTQVKGIGLAIVEDNRESLTVTKVPTQVVTKLPTK